MSIFPANPTLLLAVTEPLPDGFAFPQDNPTLFEYALPTNDMAPSLPRGTWVTLRHVTLNEVCVGDVLLRVYCAPTRRKVLELGRLKMPRYAELYRHGFITLTRDSDGMTLFDNVPWDMPNIYWFRVEQVLRIARPAPYWSTESVPSTWSTPRHRTAA